MKEPNRKGPEVDLRGLYDEAINQYVDAASRHSNQPGRGPKHTKLGIRDLQGLQHIAVDRGDKAWFNELSDRINHMKERDGLELG